MSYSYAIINTLKNVPSFRGHTVVYHSICARECGTFFFRYIIYTKDDIQIVYKNGTYLCGGFSFQLKDGLLIYGNEAIKLSNRKSISTVERLSLSLAIQISTVDKNMEVDLAKHTFREVLSHIVCLALKDLNIIHSQFTFKKQIAYAENLLSAYLSASSSTGRISSDNPHIRWLNEQDTLQLKAKLFKTSAYKVDSHSMKYEPTKLAHDIFSHAFELLKAVDFKHADVRLSNLDFIVDINLLSKIKMRDVMLLLKDCVQYSNGFVIRPQLNDRQDSRVYSVFTEISSKTRKELGFVGYDIGSACQTICLQLVDDVSKYPTHQALVQDKNIFRALIAKEMNQSIQWAKKELNKADNIETMPTKYKRSKILTDYFNEATQLRKEIIQNAEPLIYERAYEYAKTKKKKVWNSETKKYDFIDDGKKESSIFFFIWTQWERLIRHAMIKAFSEPKKCHEVHDAVYSKESIEPSFIEKVVLERTGFIVKISTD